MARPIASVHSVLSLHRWVASRSTQNRRPRGADRADRHRSSLRWTGLRCEALFKAVLSVAGDFPRQAKLWISNATANDFPKVNETVWHNNHCTNVSHEATKSELR